MQEHITKHSPVLGKDAVYTKTVSCYLNTVSLLVVLTLFLIV